MYALMYVLLSDAPHRCHLYILLPEANCFCHIQTVTVCLLSKQSSRTVVVVVVVDKSESEQDRLRLVKAVLSLSLDRRQELRKRARQFAFLAQTPPRRGLTEGGCMVTW